MTPNQSLNNTAIIFRDAEHEKAIIKFYEDNGYKFGKNGKVWGYEDTIGVLSEYLNYYYNTDQLKIITLPPGYEPKQIDFDQMALDFAKEMQLTTIEPTLELWKNFKENYK